jgi:hypothetical protein
MQNLCRDSLRDTFRGGKIKFGIIMLSNEVLEQVGQETRYVGPELQTHDVLQDLTLRHLLEIAP